MRLVLDTNVLVAAVRSPQGSSAALLEAMHDFERNTFAAATRIFGIEVLTPNEILRRMGL